MTDSRSSPQRFVRLLLSYSHEDVVFVQALKRALERFHVEVWMDSHQIEFGESIGARLWDLILRCDFIAVIISPWSMQSPWVHWELNAAHQREQREQVSRILPILFQGEVPPFLRHRLYADFRTLDSQKKDFQKLAAMLLRMSGQSPNLQYGVDQFRPAHSSAVLVAPAPLPVVPKPGKHLMTSPMVGTLYRASSAGAKPFIDVGSPVRQGEPIVIIEAMKIMNEIEADRSGTVARILVDDGDPVEYGDPLVEITLGR